MAQKLSFGSDYMEGAHPKIIERLVATNLEQTGGYGFDEYTEEAKAKIREACACPEAEVFLLVGGTQTNVTVIDSLLASYQGVVAANTGHVSCHEAGAIEFGGHKVLALPHKLGKISAEQIDSYVTNYYGDENHEHMVMPGMVYISQPTEYGTLYSLEELKAISEVCHKFAMKLYVDGARLAYALAAPTNDVTLPDLAKLCDVFYIGGTKCGALFGEAVVIPQAGLIPHFFSIIKQHGALFAKGRILGLQFATLFTDGLYAEVGKNAVEQAQMITQALVDNNYQLPFISPTNQVFAIVDNAKLPALGEEVVYGFWEKYDDNHTVIRFATSWATKKENTLKLLEIIKKYQ